MKPRFLILIFLLLLIGLSAQATDLIVNLSLFNLTPSTNRTVILQLDTAPDGQGGGIVLSDPIRYSSGAGGTFTVTNIAAGFYHGRVLGPPRETTFDLLITATNLGTIYAHTNLAVAGANTWSPGKVAWSAASSDARYAQIALIGNGYNANQLHVNASSQVEIISGATATNLAINGATITVGPNLGYIFDTGAHEFYSNPTLPLGDHNSPFSTLYVTSMELQGGSPAAGQFPKYQNSAGLLAPASLAASDIASGVMATARLASSGTANSTTYLRGDQSWSSLAASDVTSGTFGSGRLGSGTANSTTYLRGDSTWQTLTISAISDLDTNKFVNTADARILAFSNALSQVGVSNLWTANWIGKSYTGSGSFAWTNGALYFNYPQTSINYMFLNPSHGGIGDGSELQLQANLLFLGPQDGGHIQLGLGSQNAIVAYMQYATPASGDVHKGLSHKLGWRAGYDVPPGYSVFHITQWNSEATNYDNVDGHGELQFYSPQLPESSTDTSLGTNMFSLDSHGWTKAQSYRRIHYEPTFSGTNIAVSMLKDSQAFILSTNANVTLTDVLLTNLAWRGDLFFYSPFTNQPIAFPSGWSWESESGTNTAATNVPGSGFLHVQINYSIGTATNIIANAKTGTYTPVMDSDAAAFFTAAGITDGTQKAAINQFVLNAKAHGTWTLLKAFYPFVGGTTNSCSFNLVNPGTTDAAFRIAWPTAPTCDANGITGNGSTMYGDTHFKPSANGALTNCGIYAYVRTTTPTDGGWFIGAVSSTGGQAFHGIFRTGNNLGGGGLNINDQTSVALASADLRGNNGFWRGSSTVQIIAHNATHTGGSGTATGVNVVEEINLLCRKWEGFAPDNFSNANLGCAAITQWMTDAQITSFYSDTDALMTTLGRKVP